QGKRRCGGGEERRQDGGDGNSLHRWTSRRACLSLTRQPPARGRAPASTKTNQRAVRLLAGQGGLSRIAFVTARAVPLPPPDAATTRPMIRHPAAGTRTRHSAPHALHLYFVS